MNNTPLLITIVCLALAYPIYFIQYKRYQAIKAECMQEYRRNERILDSTMCADANERLFLGKKIQQVCIDAERENLITPSDCALRNWWHQFWVYTFFHQMTDSYWKVMPVGLVAFFILLWFASNHWIERVRIREFARLFGQAKQETMQVVEPFHRLEPRKRYRPIIRVEEPSSPREWNEDDYVPQVGATNYG